MLELIRPLALPGMNCPPHLIALPVSRLPNLLSPSSLQMSCCRSMSRTPTSAVGGRLPYYWYSCSCVDGS